MSKPIIIRFAAALLLVALIGCATGSPSRASRDLRQQPASPEMITRIYDVRDLLVHIPDFDNAPDFNLDEGKQKPQTTNSPEPSRESLVNHLMREIQSTIDPSSWQANGPGTIRETAGQFVILQTPVNHRAIISFLETFRQQRSVQITIESRFLKNLDEDFGHAGGVPAGQWIDHGDFAMWSRPLSDEAVKSILTSVDANRQGIRITAPRITVFDGQRAYVMVATAQAYVKEVHRIASTTQPGAFALEPQIGTVQSGLVLDVQAKVSGDRRNVSLTLKPQLNNLVSMEKTPLTGLPADGDPVYIQVPHVRGISVDSTMTVADQHTLLFRLTEHEKPTPTTHPADALVYFLVRPEIIGQTPIPEKHDALSSAENVR